MNPSKIIAMGANGGKSYIKYEITDKTYIKSKQDMLRIETYATPVGSTTIAYLTRDEFTKFVTDVLEDW